MSQLFSPTSAQTGGQSPAWAGTGRSASESAGRDRMQWASMLTQSLQPADKNAPSARTDAADRSSRKAADKSSKTADKSDSKDSRQVSDKASSADDSRSVASDKDDADKDTQTSAQELANAVIVPAADAAEPRPGLVLDGMGGKAGGAAVVQDVASMQELLASQAAADEGEGQQQGSQGQQSGGAGMQAMLQAGEEANGESSEMMTMGAKAPSAVQPVHAETATQPIAGVAASQGQDASVNRIGGPAAPAGLAGMDDLSAEDMDPNVARVAQGLRGAINLKGGAVTIRLNPAELGLVRIEMEIQGGSVKAELQSENASVRDLLTHQLGRLRETLQSRGLAVERLEVSATNAPDASQSGRGEQDASGDGRSRGQFFSQQQSSQQQEQRGERGKARSTFGRLLVDTVG